MQQAIDAINLRSVLCVPVVMFLFSKNIYPVDKNLLI